MSVMNFDGVDKAPDKGITAPGTIDVFEITEIEFGESTNNRTPYMRTTFENDATSFRHSFFTTTKALSRIQTLAEAALGKKFVGDMTEEGLKAALLHKSVALKVSGSVNQENGKGYPDLGFGGFAKPVAQVAELQFTPRENELIEAAREAIANSRASQADTEGGESTDAVRPTGDDTDF